MNTRHIFRAALCPVICMSLVVGFSACTKKASSEAVPGKIAGTIAISPQLQAKLKPTDTLYIIARAQQIGPPSAVKRITSPTFPLHYVIGPEDAMMAGMGGFEAGSNLTLAARISRTGNAMPSAGDLEGIFPKNPAHPGEGGVDVVIDRERE